jgi:hypothetical protein
MIEIAEDAKTVFDDLERLSPAQIDEHPDTAARPACSRIAKSRWTCDFLHSL